MKYEDFELIDFDKVDIEEVDFDSSKIDKAKKRLIDSIANLKKNNEELYIDDNIDIISDICKEYHIDLNDIYSGEHNNVILKNLIFRSIANKVEKEYNNILFKGFFKKGSDYVFNNIMYYSETTYYYIIFVTKAEIIIFNLNNYYQVIKESKYNLSSIKGFGINRAEYHKELQEVDRFKLSVLEDCYYMFANSKCVEGGNINKLEEVFKGLLSGDKEKYYDEKYFMTKDNKALKISGNISLIFALTFIIGLILILVFVK